MNQHQQCLSAQVPASLPNSPQVEVSFTADSINMPVKFEMVIKDSANIPSNTGGNEFTVTHHQRW